MNVWSYGALWICNEKGFKLLGSILIMVLIGFIIASIVNIFFFNETIYWILSGIGIIIFCSLTAYDVIETPPG